MNRTIAGWLKVLGAGSSGATGVIMVAATLDAKAIWVAILTGISSAGLAAWALVQTPPTAAPPAPGPLAPSA